MCQQNQIKRFIKKLNRIIKLMSKKMVPEAGLEPARGLILAGF